MRFMFSRRWALFALAVVVLAYGCWWLGGWQFGRLHDRETRNAQTRTNLVAAPVPVGRVLRPGRPVPERDEWRRVTATGTYLADRSVIIKYQTRDGSAGVDVATPLRTVAGPSVVVDRGWMKTENVGADRVRTPAPPSGRVTVTGWVRADGTGGSATVHDGAARSVSAKEIGTSLHLPVYGGFVDALKESPAAARDLVAAEKPDLGNGPHFFYGLQWWFFGVLAVFGFGYLAYDERRRLQAGQRPGQRPGRRAPRGRAQSARSIPPSTGTIAPETKPAAGESRNAATAPNSSGRP